eukprot:m.6703 g.6703  ORF g.6703 m.6703 type:complete len:109 (+) comp16638_c0_seq1:42-368(+)
MKAFGEIDKALIEMEKHCQFGEFIEDVFEYPYQWDENRQMTKQVFMHPFEYLAIESEDVWAHLSFNLHEMGKVHGEKMGLLTRIRFHEFNEEERYYDDYYYEDGEIVN